MSFSAPASRSATRAIRAFSPSKARRLAPARMSGHSRGCGPDEPLTRRQGRQFRRDQIHDIGRGRQGQPPDLYRRRRIGAAPTSARGRSPAITTAFSNIERDRRRSLHRLQLLAGRPREHRRRRLCRLGFGRHAGTSPKTRSRSRADGRSRRPAGRGRFARRGGRRKRKGLNRDPPGTVCSQVWRWRLASALMARLLLCHPEIASEITMCGIVGILGQGPSRRLLSTR